MIVGVASHGRAYAYCEHCGEFDTRDTREKAQRWLDLHFNFMHAGFGCTSCARAARANASLSTPDNDHIGQRCARRGR